MILNPANPRQVLEAIDHASQAEDAFIVHFDGHGPVTSHSTLSLAMQTTGASSRFTSLAWKDVRSLIAKSPKEFQVGPPLGVVGRGRT